MSWDGFKYVTRHEDAQALSTITTTAQAQSTVATSAISSAKFNADLPAPPHWLVAIFAGLLTFGFILAIGLYLINFPPDLSWVARLQEWKSKQAGYQQVPSDGQDHKGEDCYTTSTPGHDTVRRRPKKALRVDTSAPHLGLGMTASGGDDHAGGAMTEPSKRRSLDEEALRPQTARPGTPAVAAWTALSAPLPQMSPFGATYNAASDLEDGTYNPSTAAIFDRNSPVHRSKLGVSPGPMTAGFLRNIRGGVEHAAEHLSNVLYDQVKGSAEEGLLLPVRECERESGGSGDMGVCV